jgi:hypothetical protein
MLAGSLKETQAGCFGVTCGDTPRQHCWRVLCFVVCCCACWPLAGTLRETQAGCFGVTCGDTPAKHCWGVLCFVVCCCACWPLAGTLKETQAELARLRKLAATLASGDAAAAAAKPAAGDEGGRLLTLILRWREMRHAAVQREVAVLEQREKQLMTGQLPTAADAFTAWLAENRVQVSTACLHLLFGHLCQTIWPTYRQMVCLAAAHIADPKPHDIASIQHALHPVSACLANMQSTICLAAALVQDLNNMGLPGSAWVC